MFAYKLNFLKKIRYAFLSFYMFGIMCYIFDVFIGMIELPTHNNK